MDQPDLFPSRSPQISDAELACLLAYLHGRGWRTAKQIIQDLGWAGTPITERYLRLIAHASRGKILSYPGSPGYRLTTEATLEEINAARCLLDQFTFHFSPLPP